MSRNSLGRFQKTVASMVPEFDFDSITQTDVDAWTSSADLTMTIIDYAQFQSESGYSGSHPLSNLNKDKVLKVVVSTANTATLFLATDEAASPFQIASGTTGLYIWVDETNWGEMFTAGAPGVKLWCLDGSISDYRAWGGASTNINTAGEWNLIGGIDDDDYDVQAAGAPTLIDLIRINVDTNAGDPTFYITGIFNSAKRRPVIMLEQDDISLDTTEFFDDLDTYGLKGSVCGIHDNVDLAGRPTTAQMKTILDNGHFVYTHGSLGLRTDLAGNSATFIAQWESELASWRAFYPSVLDDTTLLHGALPLSETDETTREWMRANGFKTMRRTGTTPYQGLISQPEYNNTQYMHLPAWGLDAQTSAVLIAAIDKAIVSGTDLCMYLHQYITTSANRAAVQAMMAHIKLRQDQGLIECLPRHLWYERSIKEAGQRDFV